MTRRRVKQQSHSSLGVEHSLSKRKVVGSNPACGLSDTFFFGRSLVISYVDLSLEHEGLYECSGGVVGYHVSLTH